jgi:glucose uptake protein GlcU
MAGTLFVCFGILAMMLPEFLALFSAFFSEIAAMWLIVVGAALIALEQKTDVRIQHHAILLTGAAALVIGTMGLMVQFRLSPDLFGVVNLRDIMGTLLYVAIGGWAVMTVMEADLHSR